MEDLTCTWSTTTMEHTTTAARPREAGVSIVEVLIAAIIFLILTIGILPIFVHGIRSNARGSDSTTVANLARSRLEGIAEMPFTDGRLAIDAGETERLVTERYEKENAGWYYGTESFWDSVAQEYVDGPAPPTGPVWLWTREIRIRQFSIGDLLDDGELDTPLDGATAPGQVQIKEVQITVRPGGGANFGWLRGRDYVVTLMKAI